LSADGVVFRPRRHDGTGEGQDIFGVEVVIGGWRGGEPLGAVCDGLFGVFANVGGGMGIGGVAADVLEALVEGLDATVVVGGPAAVLVAADAAFEPVHAEVDSRQFTVQSRPGQIWGMRASSGG